MFMEFLETALNLHFHIKVLETFFPAGIYVPKVNNRNTGTSSNVNEVIRSVLHFFLFLKKDIAHTKTLTSKN